MINLARIPSKLRLYTFCVLAWLVFNAGADAQSDSTLSRLKSFVQNINTFNTLLPQEKVYLHFDNTSYFLGEHIWFKAYVVNPTENRPTAMSKVLYVELLNQQGIVLQTRKLKIDDNGQCHGDFALTDSMFAGFYEVRAYTRYMLNFEWESKWRLMGFEENYLMAYFTKPRKWIQEEPSPVLTDYHTGNNIFSRVFPVYNKSYSPGAYSDKQMMSRTWITAKPFNEIVAPNFYYEGFWYQKYNDNFKKNNFPMEIPAKPVFNISFFPEGGDAVQGLTSCIAFKAMDDKNTDLDISGDIVDPNGNDVTSFKTQQRGMGMFNLNYELKGQYTARIFYNNQLYRFNLPTCQPSGYVMRVNNLTSDKQLYIEFEKSGENIVESLGLSIMCRGKVLWFDTLSLSYNHTPRTLSVPKRNLITGVNQITLFNQQGKILAERLCFVNNQDLESIQLSSNTLKQSYKPFENINLDFYATNQYRQALQTTFSLAIRDEATTEATYNTDNILTNLLLTSELKGYLADPAYYFQDNNQTRKAALDLLMLTQGWKRYQWKDMARLDSFSLKELPEKGLMMEGVVTKYNQFKNGNFPTTSYLSVYYASIIMKDERYIPYDDEWRKMIKDAIVKVSIATNDSSGLTGKQHTTNGRFRFKLPDFQGEKQVLLEMSDSINETPVNKKGTSSFIAKLSKGVKDIYKESFVAHIRRFPVLPKEVFTYYETNTPLKSYQTNNSKEDNIRTWGIGIKEITIQSRPKEQGGLPDFTQPDIVLTGKQVQEMAADRSRCEVTYFPDALKASISDALHLNVDNLDLYVVRQGIGNVYQLFEYSKFTQYNRIDPSKSYYTFSSQEYQIEDIASINIYLRSGSRIPFQYSFPSAYILINMRDIAYPRDSINTRTATIQGYSYLSDFYHPDYSKGVPPETRDFRRTLYWNPDVQTDSTGKATVTFYNNATCKQLEISAEGITKEGVPFVYKKEP